MRLPLFFLNFPTFFIFKNVETVHENICCKNQSPADETLVLHIQNSTTTAYLFNGSVSIQVK